MPAQRFDTLDALRGVAIVWMSVFHFLFDLNHFGYLQQNFYHDPFWTLQRSAIVSFFLFCAGLGQAVAVQQGQSPRRFWKRWLQIAVCALLVTAGSYWMYPKSFIYFGVLHGIAVMLVITRFTAKWGRWLWLAGGLAIATKIIATYAHSIWAGAEFLNDPGFNWLGLISRKPITEDYVPLLPWLGVMWWGMAAGQWLLREAEIANIPFLGALAGCSARRSERRVASHTSEEQRSNAPGSAAKNGILAFSASLRHRADWLRWPLPSAGAPLAWLGRWSLSWYMLHQPVLIGLLMGLAALK